jgi:hypothetical protein
MISNVVRIVEAFIDYALEDDRASCEGRKWIGHRASVALEKKAFSSLRARVDVV